MFNIECFYSYFTKDSTIITLISRLASTSIDISKGKEFDQPFTIESQKTLGK